MRKAYLWTKSKARLQCVNSTPGKYHWLFLPGGPGLGSESLAPLTNILQLPGSTWHVDFPGDGSNLLDDSYLNIALWKKALIEAVSALNNVILVAHSSSGMFALTITELEKILSGLVLIGSTPDTSWQKAFMQYVKLHPLAKVEKLQKLYTANPSNKLLKQLTIAAAPNFLTAKGIKKNSAFLNSLPYNSKSHIFFDKHFHENYKAKWFPKKMPTLIFTGEQDPITPLTLFKNSKQFRHSNILIEEIRNA